MKVFPLYLIFLSPSLSFSLPPHGVCVCVFVFMCTYCIPCAKDKGQHANFPLLSRGFWELNPCCQA